MHLNMSQLNLLEAIWSEANAPRMSENNTRENADVPLGVSQHNLVLKKEFELLMKIFL